MDRDARLRILYVSKRLPVRDATHAGGRITFHYLDSLATWANVDLLAMLTGHESPTELPEVRSFRPVQAHLDSNASSPKGLLARAVAFSRLLVWTIRMARSQCYDLLILERSALSWMAPVVRRVTGATNILLIVHDFWFDRLEADAASLGPPRGVYYTFLSRIASRIETWGVLSVSGIICYDYRTRDLVLRMQERGRNATRAAVLLMPPYFTKWSESAKVSSRISFYGSMSRSVNWRSAKWFIELVLPQIRAVIPGASFSVVGANPPDELLRYGNSESVIVTGYLEDPGPYLAASEVFVAPLISGTGIKIKVLEAMAAGVPVVANDIAMQGIPAQANRDYLHAQSVDEFAIQVVKVLQDVQLRTALAESARKLVASRFSLSSAQMRQQSFIEYLAGNGARHHGWTERDIVTK